MPCLSKLVNKNTIIKKPNILIRSRRKYIYLSLYSLFYIRNKAICAELLELNLKNEPKETGKRRRNGKKQKNKTKATSAKLLELNLMNKLDKTGGQNRKKLKETGRNKDSE